MSIAIRASFWVMTIGGCTYALFKVFKPNDELLKEVNITFCTIVVVTDVY